MKFDIPHVELFSPHVNGTSDEHAYDDLVAAFKEIKTKLENGDRVYVGYLSGERAGSIGYIKSDYNLERVIPEVTCRYDSWYKEDIWRCHAGFHCVLGWDGRRNTAKCYVGHNMVYFPNYDGPTIWEKFDKKGAEKAAAESVVVEDRDGNVLQVGDRVLYINARYGGAAQLDRGTIADIKVKINKYQHNTYSALNVIIDNDEGEQSTITVPDRSILKLQA